VIGTRFMLLRARRSATSQDTAEAAPEDADQRV
jgi:hypothetical protein